MQAYQYVRFSSVKQEKGDSVRRQKDAIEKFCDQQGWKIVEQIEDLGASAWTGEHLTTGNLGKFAERVRTGDIALPAVLVVERLDRISRQKPRKTLRWMEDLAELGLSIATVDGSRVYSNASLEKNQIEVIEIIMRAELANKESTQKSERVLDAIGEKMVQAARGGPKITAKGPGWLTLSEDRRSWIENDARVELVCDIYLRAAEGQGPRWIAKSLNQAGIEAWGPPRKDGKPRTWQLSSVRLILTQPSVEGDYHPGFSNKSADARTKFTQPILGYFPRVVDADLVARARAALDGRKLGPKKTPRADGVRTGGRHRAGVANLFSGLAYCRACGARMHLKSKSNLSNRRYLQCHKATNSAGCRQTAGFDYDALEGTVLDQVLHLALDDRHFARPDQTGTLAVLLAEVEKEIADRKETGDRLITLAIQTDQNAQVVAQFKDNSKALAVLEGRRVEVSQQLAAARGAVSPEEHLARVRELRSALQDEDKVTREAARLRVQSAMKAIELRLECGVTPDGDRQTLMMLRTGFVCRIAQDGALVKGRLDLATLADRGEGAEAAAQLLSDATELLVGLREGKIAADWGARRVEPEFIQAVGTHLDRQRRKAEEDTTDGG